MLESTFHNVAETRISKVFMWMFMGLGITALTSWFLYSSGLFLSMMVSVPYLSWILCTLQIVLTVMMSRSLSKTSPATNMIIMFVVYCICMGISLTSLAFCYSLGQIGIAFGISSVYFGCLAIIGKTTKINLSKVGNICMIGLLAMIVTQILFMIFKVSVDVRLWSIVGLLIFTGLTAWDIQRMYNWLESDFYADKIVIYVALQLYLDFINIFLYILQLIGNRDN